MPSRVHYGGDEALEARVDSLESGDAWSNKTTGYVPVVQSDGSIAWEAASGGGGGGVLDPTADITLEDGAALELLDTASGAHVRMAQDTANYGAGTVGHYPNALAGSSGAVYFGPGALPDGSVPTASVAMDVTEFAAIVQAVAKSSAAGATMRAAYDGENSRGLVRVVGDAGINEALATAFEVYSSELATTLQVFYDGTVQWGNDTPMRRVAAGVVGILHDGGGIQFTSPDGQTTKTLSIDNAGDPVWT